MTTFSEKCKIFDIDIKDNQLLLYIKGDPIYIKDKMKVELSITGDIEIEDDKLTVKKMTIDRIRINVE